jgi:LysR family transcriptional regulator, glycine cleavage system transcriptional activator
MSPIDSPLSNLPPMDCLVAALTAARCGSFSQAAAELGVTHAAVSRRVASAERWAGVSLFERHGRGIRVTGDGQRMLGRIRHALEMVEEAADRWHKKDRIKTLRIATTHSLAQLWLIEKISHLEARLPGTRIELLTDHRNVNLAAGDAEIAIRCGRGNWKEGRETPLFTMEAVQPIAQATAWKSWLEKFAGGRRTASINKLHAITAAQLLELPLIHDGDSSVWRSWFAAQGVAFKTKASDRMVANYALALRAASAGLGIALHNCAIGGIGAMPGQLVPVGLPAALTPVLYYVIVHDTQIAPNVRSCAQLLIAEGAAATSWAPKRSR